MVGARQVEVLLVDGCGEDIEPLQAAFDATDSRHVLRVVHNSAAALAWLRGASVADGSEPSPSLILLNMNCETDGRPAVTAALELLGELKGDEGLRSIPVIVITENADAADVLNAYSIGACSFVSRPADRERRHLLFHQLADYWAHVAQLPLAGSNTDIRLEALLDCSDSDTGTEPVPVLVVDDSEDDVLLLKEAFVDSPCVEFVATVEDGESALRYLRREAPYQEARRPALILLDINMPRMNGFEVLAEMRADPRLAGTPVVMLTTSKQESDILRAYSDGACSFISKPVNFDRMRGIAQRFAQYWTLVANTPPVDMAVAH